jgi:hypothetical protein
MQIYSEGPFPFPYADLKSLFTVPRAKNNIFPHIRALTVIHHVYTQVAPLQPAYIRFCAQIKKWCWVFMSHHEIHDPRLVKLWRGNLHCSSACGLVFSPCVRGGFRLCLYDSCILSLFSVLQFCGVVLDNSLTFPSPKTLAQSYCWCTKNKKCLVNFISALVDFNSFFLLKRVYEGETNDVMI